jgi:hypothetical protein
VGISAIGYGREQLLQRFDPACSHQHGKALTANGQGMLTNWRLASTRSQLQRACRLPSGAISLYISTKTRLESSEVKMVLTLFIAGNQA